MDHLQELTSGDHRRALVALRDVLAGHLIAAEPSVSAQIAARLQAVLAELATLKVPDEGSASDDIARKRAARRAAAEVGKASA